MANPIYEIPHFLQKRSWVHTFYDFSKISLLPQPTHYVNLKKSTVSYQFGHIYWKNI